MRVTPTARYELLVAPNTLTGQRGVLHWLSLCSRRELNGAVAYSLPSSDKEARPCVDPFSKFKVSLSAVLVKCSVIGHLGTRLLKNTEIMVPAHLLGSDS